MSFTGSKRRYLRRDEKQEAIRVFASSLPEWDRITITDGLGFENSYWTQAVPESMWNPWSDLEWVMHLGPTGFSSALNIKATFIHELTHVWQGYNSVFGDAYMFQSLYAQAKDWVTSSDSYDVEPGKAWNDYNVEQQASIVEDWYKGGEKRTDPRFRYIRQYIWPGRSHPVPQRLRLPDVVVEDNSPKPANISMAGKEHPRKITLPDALFEFDSAKLNPRAEKALRQAAAHLNQPAKATVVISGHTDSLGAAAYNFVLSQKRANAVREWFIRHGVFRAQTFTAVGYGESQPVASNNTAEGRRRNRRVEIQYDYN